MGKVVTAIIVALAASICCESSRETWYVDGSMIKPGDGSSWDTALKGIQSGIDKAGDGDTVIVAEGTYVENIQFKGKNIVLRSTDPLDPAIVANTIIDGNQAGSVVSFAGSEDDTCALAGFTIRNGNGSNGGGISGSKEWAYGARALLENNLIVDNTALRGGGIAYCDGIIRNNTISGNTATERQYGGGGVHGCDGLIEQNLITDNTAALTGGGLNFCGGTIQENVIAHNSAPGGGGLSSCHMTIARNLIYDNVATEYEGGGLSGCGGIIENNLIVSNIAEMSGGGLANCGSLSLPGLVQNNVICANSAGYAGAGLARCVGTIQNCIIWSNESPEGPQVAPPISPLDSLPVYSCIQDWTGGGEGNISDDPDFADAGGIDGDPKTYDGSDYRLLPDSPCIDAGRNDDGSWDAVDLDGQRRIFYGISSMTVDMGAYEFRSISPERTAWHVDAAVPVSKDGRTPVTALRSISEGIQVAWEGDEVIVAQGVYLENVQFRGRNIILRSTDPLASGVVANTIIDGNQAGSAVSFAGTEDETCVLAGFTIQNGSDHISYGGGGGICGRSGMGWNTTRATITNNVITGNSALRGGGGVAYCDGRIQNNTIRNNSATSQYYGGGGLYNCHGPIENNAITGNSASDGGGLAECDGTIQNNTIRHNSASSPYYGHGGGLAGCSGSIQNNAVTENSAHDGGGLYDCDGAILNNSISGNSAWSGGGLFFCDGAIRNNLIAENTAVSIGGGLFWCDGLIQNNVITANSAESGGGLNFCTGTIVKNTVSLNRAIGSVASSGGGFNSCHGVIQQNVIAANTSEWAGGGLSECDATFRNNLIAGNTAGEDGGAFVGCDGTIENCTIVGNAAQRRGGALYLWHDAIRNCIIWDNEAGDGSQLDLSDPPTYTCIQNWTEGGEGNINADPLFVDADGPDDDPSTFEDNDYRLAAGSPCIDTGKNEDWMWHAVDLDGNPRIWGDTVDMGAYEYGSFPFKITEVTRVEGSKVSWSSRPGDTYTIWSCTHLSGGQWNEEGTISSGGETTTWTDPDNTSPCKFYRVGLE